MRRPVQAPRARISSSFTPPISTAFSLMRVKPALRAASRPASVSESEPMRVIFGIFGVERVKADVQPVETGAFQTLCVLGQPCPVRRHRKLADTLDGAQTAHQLIDAAPHERLAAGQPHLAHAERHRRADDLLDLLERQHRLVRQLGDALRAHAVHAAAAAQIGHGKAQDLIFLPY